MNVAFTQIPQNRNSAQQQLGFGAIPVATLNRFIEQNNLNMVTHLASGRVSIKQGDSFLAPLSEIEKDGIGYPLVRISNSLKNVLESIAKDLNIGDRIVPIGDNYNRPVKDMERIMSIEV